MYTFLPSVAIAARLFRVMNLKLSSSIYLVKLLQPRLEEAEMIDGLEHELNGHLVLVVDDDFRIRFYVKTILQSARFRVLEAGDGLEALELFRASRDRIALVITDIRMPGMSGSELAKHLRLDCPGIPLIFVSGEPAPVDTNDSTNGFLFIEKPFAPKTLLEAACQFLDSMPVTC
jgi:two-component system, cell cycle sensor histidine kinase and response regulator CckA